MQKHIELSSKLHHKVDIDKMVSVTLQLEKNFGGKIF
jgi:hypothetical protein